jgi:hypothetical protein
MNVKKNILRDDVPAHAGTLICAGAFGMSDNLFGGVLGVWGSGFAERRIKVRELFVDCACIQGRLGVGFRSVEN